MMSSCYHLQSEYISIQICSRAQNIANVKIGNSSLATLFITRSCPNRFLYRAIYCSTKANDAKTFMQCLLFVFIYFCWFSFFRGILIQHRVPVIEFIESTRVATTKNVVDTNSIQNSIEICIFLCRHSEVGVLEAICSFIFLSKSFYRRPTKVCRGVWIRQCSTLRTSFSIIKVNFPKRRKSDSQFMN